MTDTNDPELLERILSVTAEFFYTIEVSPEGRLSNADITGALERITGFTKEEMDLKGGPEGIIYPADYPKFKGLLKAAKAGEETTVEYRIVAKDGGFRCLRDHARPERDSCGNVARIVGAVCDISELREVEEARSDSIEDYYKKLFEAAGDAISIVDPETEIVIDVNPKACEMYGFTREEFIGLSFVTLTQQKVRGQVEIKKFFSTGVSPLHRTIHYTKDGKELNLEIRGSIIELDGKKALMSIHRDVSERDE